MSWQRRNRYIALETPWLKVFRDVYSLPDGTEVDDFYIVERDDFVLVVAEYLDRVVLVRQYRPATDRYYYSLPAGYIRHGEPPETAAARELMEEAGVESEAFVLTGELHPLPGYVKSFAYVVTCRLTTDVLAVRDIEEIDSVQLVSWPKVLQMIRQGQINEMQAVAALLLVHLQRAEL